MCIYFRRSELFARPIGVALVAYRPAPLRHEFMDRTAVQFQTLLRIGNPAAFSPFFKKGETLPDFRCQRDSEKTQSVAEAGREAVAAAGLKIEVHKIK